MATNRIHEEGTQLFLTVGSGVSSGDKVLIGDIPGVALIDADSNNKATVQTDGVFDLEVHGVNDAGSNAAVSEGDILYWNDGAGSLDAGDLTVDSTSGTRFGYALEAVSGGSTTTIKVKIGY